MYSSPFHPKYLPYEQRERGRPERGERVRVYRGMFALPEAQIVYSGIVVNEPLRSPIVKKATYMFFVIERE